MIALTATGHLVLSRSLIRMPSSVEARNCPNCSRAARRCACSASSVFALRHWRVAMRQRVRKRREYCFGKRLVRHEDGVIVGGINGTHASGALLRALIGVFAALLVIPSAVAAAHHGTHGKKHP